MKHTEKTKIYRLKYYTFDIETTTLVTGFDSEGNPQRNAIIWSGQFFDGVIYTQVRDIFETVDFLKKLEAEAIDNYKGEKLLVVVHNLSYEYQFIKSFFTWTNIIATGPRKIIAAETKGLVFRCSYMLSNMSLDKFLKNEGVPEKYQKTNMDYLIERYPWTELTEEEKEYCANDVIGLHMAIKKRIDACFHKDVNNLPLTSTGYVRKACRDAWQKNKKNKYRFWNEALDLDTFNMLHTAFRGGNTHANRYYVNKSIISRGYRPEG